MTDPPIDPSIFQEPHLTRAHHSPDPAEAMTEESLLMEGSPFPRESDRADQSVFDDPSYEGPIPDNVLTYWRWIEKRGSETSWAESLLATLVLAVAAGPWAVLGALLQGGSADFGDASYLVGVCIIAPVVEEMMKLAAALYVVERRPFYFKSSWQILLCALAGGVVFGVLENFLYLEWYIEDPSPLLVRWRWMVCTALHASCSTLAGCGLVRVWRDHRFQKRIPDLTLATPFLIAAMVLHGAYNLFASFLWLAGFEF